MKITQFFAIYLTLTQVRGILTHQEVLSREKRLIYPAGADVGVLFAIAIPLDIPHRSVFVSYNFEANFPPPQHASDLLPGPFNYFGNLGRKNNGAVVNPDTECETFKNKTEAQEHQMKESTDNPHKRNTREALLTRKSVYKMFESKLKKHGHRGRACLLRAICESAESPIHELTGVIGDVFHIVLTPSTSIREDLHPEYYNAEELGRSGDCSKYTKYCPLSVLNYISEVMHIM